MAFRELSIEEIDAANTRIQTARSFRLEQERLAATSRAKRQPPLSEWERHAHAATLESMAERHRKQLEAWRYIEAANRNKLREQEALRLREAQEEAERRRALDEIKAEREKQRRAIEDLARRQRSADHERQRRERSRATVEAVRVQRMDETRAYAWRWIERKSTPLSSPVKDQETRLSQDAIRQALLRLPARLERVIRLRFGLGCEPRTLQEVAELFNLSRERIRQMETKAIRSLQAPEQNLKPVARFVFAEAA